MIDDRRRASRLLLLATIGGAHLAAIWLLFSSSQRERPTTADPILALFDVAPIVVSPEPLPPPPPLKPTPVARTASGGSPGARRERAAARIDAPARPLRAAMDATFNSLSLGPPPVLLTETAAFDVGNGDADGRSTGNSAGSVPGDGNGRGAGDDAEEFGRAEWVKRPSDRSFALYWPRSQARLAREVVVVLSCLVRRSGVPYRCRLRSEVPRGLGFARTAMMVMPEARVRPVSRNGAPLWDKPVLITVIFDAIEVAPRVPITAAASAPPAL